LRKVEAAFPSAAIVIGDENGQILARDRVATTDPATTLAQVVRYFKEQEAQFGEGLVAIGIGSFGPLDLNPASETYGYITRTPKAGWSYADIVGPVRAAFPDLPIGFDTDVNTAALGEHRWGAAQDWQTFVYITVGTGIGGGGMLDGQTLHGLIHPEMGHVLLPIRDDDFD